MIDLTTDLVPENIMDAVVWVTVGLQSGAVSSIRARGDSRTDNGQKSEGWTK